MSSFLTAHQHKKLFSAKKKYNSPRINGQHTNHRMIDGPLLSGFYVPIKG